MLGDLVHIEWSDCVDNLLVRLRRQKLPFNPPRSARDINLLADHLECELDPFIVSLYANHDGMEIGGEFPLRLMSGAEAMETHEELRDVDFPSREFRCFWTDDNSDYVGCYVEGLLRGKICFVMHDDADYSPRFRSVRSLYNTAIDPRSSGQGVFEMPTEYPYSHTSAVDDVAISDLAIAEQLITAYQSHSDDKLKLHTALCAMNLLPPTALSQLRPFVDSDDMWVQEHACSVLGNWKVASEVPTFARIARKGMHNGRMASIRALGQIGTEEAQTELLQLATEIDEGFKLLIAYSLESCGCQIKRDGDKWQYRTSNTPKWATL